MAVPKKKTVFTAESAQLEQIQRVVRSGEYDSASQFLREAIDEKLERLRRNRLEQQVQRYCAERASVEDPGLVATQAFDEDDR